MKKITTLVIALMPLLGMAQKEIKPSIPKAEKAWREGKLDEAKQIIDLTVANTEFMVDKKGKPSGKAAEAWYMKGLIYSSIDTTSGTKWSAISANAYQEASAAFRKAEEIDPKKATYIKDAKQFMPVTTLQVQSQLMAYYANYALKILREKDYKKSLDYIERSLNYAPKDTAILSYAGIYIAPAAEDYDKAIVYIDQYLANGGKDPNAWLQKISIYMDKKKDNVAALKVIQEAEAKFPNNEDFPKYELNIYLTEKDYGKARKFVTQSIKKHPDAPSYFMLGQLYDRTSAPDSARIAFQKSIDLDPQNFEAELELARSYYGEARKIKAQRDKLGISATDIQQRKVLFDQLKKEYTIDLPYWEKCEKMKPEDEEVLFTLNEIYTFLVMDEQQARVGKKIKDLGLDK